MFGTISYSPSFASSVSIVSPPKQPKTQSDIFKEKIQEEAQKSKQKDKEDRTVGDYINIGYDVLSKMKDVSVLHANESSKLDYTI